MGHTHAPKLRRMSLDGIYINTNTWIPIVPDSGAIGQRLELHYGPIEWCEGVPLPRWKGPTPESEEVVA